MKGRIALVILLLIVFTSCKKKGNANTDGSLNPDAVSYQNYSPRKIGSYWIYERFDVKSDGTAMSMHEVDSSYVEKDTVIGKYSYTKIMKFDFLFHKKCLFILEILSIISYIRTVKSFFLQKIT